MIFQSKDERNNKAEWGGRTYGLCTIEYVTKSFLSPWKYSLEDVVSGLCCVVNTDVMKHLLWFMSTNSAVGSSRCSIRVRKKNEGILTRLFLLIIPLMKGAVGVQRWAEAVGAEVAACFLPTSPGHRVLCRPAQQQLEHEDALDMPSDLALSESDWRGLSNPLHNANVKGLSGNDKETHFGARCLSHTSANAQPSSREGAAAPGPTRWHCGKALSGRRTYGRPPRPCAKPECQTVGDL